MSKSKIFIILIVLFSILGSVLVYKSHAGFPVVSDSDDFNQIATSLVETGHYKAISDKELIYPPVYPLFIAGSYALFGIGNFNAVYALQYLLVGAIALFVFLTLTRSFGVSLAFSFFGACLILIWPYFVTYTFILGSELVYTFFLVSAICVLTRKILNKGSLITAGVLLGLATLARPVSLLLPLAIVLGSLILTTLLKKKNIDIPKITKRSAFVLIGTFLLTLTPWITYVSIKYDRFIPVASNLSYVFAKGNKTLSYLDTEGIGAKKPSVLEAKIKNIYLFWNPGAGGYHAEMVVKKFPIAKIGIVAYKIIFYTIVTVAIVGVFFVIRAFPQISFLVYPIIYTWALHVVLFPFPRYTLPIMPFVIIVALVTISYVFNYNTSRTHSTSS